MRLIALCLAAGALAGCATASSSGSDDGTSSQRQIVTDEQGRVLRNTADLRGDVQELPVAADSAVRILRGIYAQLGVPPATLDNTGYTVGNRNFSVMRTFGGQRLSAYLDCGSSITGVAADSYRVTMSLVSRVSPATAGSTVETRLFATARDGSGVSNATVDCGTTGSLERRINTALAAQVLK